MYLRIAKRLTLEERKKIQEGIFKNKTNREIALEIGKAHTTVGRDIKRFKERFDYCAYTAHALYESRNFPHVFQSKEIM